MIVCVCVRLSGDGNRDPSFPQRVYETVKKAEQSILKFQEHIVSAVKH